MNLDLSPAEQDFRHTVRDFLAQNLPPEIQRAQYLTTTVFTEYDVAKKWQDAVYAKGWVAPSWPKEFGGPGWSVVEKYLWLSECARAGAPNLSPIGISLVGPVLLRFGTPAQKDYYLPRILSGEHYWCQGFSEPGSGSDLASLRTKAVLEGETYKVNGTKIWTTHAHFSQWMITLVRTSDAGKPQEGITCLLIDMKSPGISVRPIMTIGGDHEVNQVFLDEVEVPLANRVGAEGEGWTIAKYLLEFERGGAIASAALRSDLAEVVRLARGGIGDLPDLLDDPDIERRIAEIGIDIDALETLELKINWALQGGGNPGAASSVLKLKASRLYQAVSALAVEVLGQTALRWEPHRPLYDLPLSNSGEAETLPVMSRFLNDRAKTIFGGSQEIQLGIIAKAFLGL